MWLLKGIRNEKLIYLKPNATMTVGRNKGDIILPEDGSISRVHAEITVKSVPNYEKIIDKQQPLSKCTIKDPGSKYGNFILENGEPTIRISAEGYELHHLDVIKFGLQNYEFEVQYIPIITGTSGLDEIERESLKNVIEAIDGKTTYVWSPLCTHMTVKTPRISEKLSCALASQTPVVPILYWDAVTICFKENKALPDPAEYASVINNRMREVGEISVAPNIARKTLFKNLKFLHFDNRQFALYARMIKLAGGKSFQYRQQPTDLDVCNDNVIVVQLVESNTTQATGTGDASYAAVCEKLGTCRRRTIPESEIAIALLHCSTEKWCNPRFDYAQLFATGRTENQPRNTTVLALDTQDLEVPSTSGRGAVNNRNTVARCIPETNQESCELQIQPAIDQQERNNNGRSEEARCSASINNSITDDLPSESEIGSMKLASLNHENYQREEFNRRALNNEHLKRDRESEDESFVEKKKKICLEDSSNDKECRQGKSDQSYEHLMKDDEDAFFMDEQVSMVEEEFEIKEEKRKVPRQLSEVKELEDFRVLGNRRTQEFIDLTVNDDVPKSTSAGFSSRDRKDNSSNRMFKAGEKKSLEDSVSDEPEKSYKRKVGRSDVSPFSDAAENPRKRIKSVVAIEKQYNKLPQEATPDKKPLMDLPSTPSSHRKKNEIKEEVDWIMSTTLNFVDSEKYSSTVSDKLGNRSSRDYDKSQFFMFPNDPNSTILPLLRIKTPADIYTKDSTPRFGKCFRKQKIRIPIRIELDGSTYDSSNIEHKTKKRLSSDDDEEASTSRIVIPDIFSRAKKNVRI